MHALLKRQLRKLFGDRGLPPEMREFIALVDETYHQADDDRRLLERAFELSSQEWLDANAELSGALDALADAAERAEQASRAKDEFLAILGHELRNPLAPLVTALDRARRRGDTTIDTKDVDRPLRQIVRLVDDLLDVARVARGLIVLDRRPLEISLAVRNALEAAGPVLAQRRHAVFVDVPDQGLLVDGDETRLSQVVVNLLTNAARYTESNGSIWIAAWTEGDQIVLRVRDSGCGIDPAVLPRIFDSFGYSRGSGAQQSAGLGLGLTIVRNMVELHGGEVTVASEGLGRGAEFQVRLPRLEQPVAVEEAPASARQIAVPEAEGVVDGARVLIVDDNREAADLLGEALRESGYEVDVVYGANDALSRAGQFQPAVAVLDIGLPEMSGYELGRRLKEQRPDGLRLIALTGFGQSSDREASRKAGFSAHLVKPVDLGTLLDAVAAPR